MHSNGPGARQPATGAPLDSYDAIWRFPSSEKGRWLRGLLKNAGHSSFLLSGPWTHEGQHPGTFANSMQTFSLFLLLDGAPLCVETGGQQRRATDREWLTTAIPLPVAQQMAADLGDSKVLTTVRRALEDFTPVATPTLKA